VDRGRAGRQVLIASIDDGSKVEVVAQVAAGSQGVVVIPLAAPSRPQPIPTGRPLNSLFVPVPKPPDPVYKTYIAVGASLAAPGPENDGAISGAPQASTGSGFTRSTRSASPSLGLATRLSTRLRQTSGDVFTCDFSERLEVIALAGSAPCHPRLHARRRDLRVSQKIEDAFGSEVEGIVHAALFRGQLGGGLHRSPAHQMGSCSRSRATRLSTSDAVHGDCRRRSGCK
jgi:hypothetical protein